MRILFLQARNLGDAVIGTGFVEAMAGHHIEVLTRPAFHDIYAQNPHVHTVHTASFPVGTNRRFSLRDAMHLLLQLLRLRRLRFDAAVTVTGDAREIAICWIAAPRGVISVRFHHDNAFGHAVRPGLGFLLRDSVLLSATDNNIYAIIQRLADLMGTTKKAMPRVYRTNGSAIEHEVGNISIGLHPSAGQACRLWPVERWKALIGLLKLQGKRIVVFAAAQERAQIEADLGDALNTDDEIFVGDVTAFMERLCGVTALVGLDSFSSHAAYAVRTPGVLIAGPSPADLFAPPDAVLLEGGPGLSCYPCYNKPSCLGQAHQYLCMRKTEASDVMDAVLHTATKDNS